MLEIIGKVIHLILKNILLVFVAWMIIRGFTIGFTSQTIGFICGALILYVIQRAKQEKVEKDYPTDPSLIKSIKEKDNYEK